MNALAAFALGGVPFVGALALAVTAGAVDPGGPAATAAGGTGPCVVSARGEFVDMTPAQLTNAQTIDTVGRELGVTPYGELIALTVARTESDLINLPGGDRDSRGLFQQRPSQGWGRPDQLLDPRYAATAFYQRLTAIPGWQRLPVTVAARTVQHSAHPHAYAHWQATAAVLLAAVNGAGSITCATTPPTPPQRLPAPSSPRAATAIRFALAQLGTPYQLPPDPPASWDCSSLIQAAYAAAGITVPRTTYQQVSASGPTLPLTPAAWRPGDLLFTMGADPLAGLPGHVGLYLGADQVLEAPHTGAVVTVTALSAFGPVVAATRPWLLAARRPRR